VALLRGWFLFWTLWLLVGVVVECLAVFVWQKPDDTFSEWTWTVFHASSRVGWFTLMFLVGFIAAWFPNHVRNLRKAKND
jgi:hypothetical protein